MTAANAGAPHAVRDEARSGVIHVGGPRDGVVLDSVHSAVVELEVDGMIHRYVTTTKQREHDDRTYQVFHYDGEINPTGARPGAETPDGGHQDPIQAYAERSHRPRIANNRTLTQSRTVT